MTRIGVSDMGQLRFQETCAVALAIAGLSAMAVTECYRQTYPYVCAVPGQVPNPAATRGQCAGVAHPFTPLTPIQLTVFHAVQDPDGIYKGPPVSVNPAFECLWQKYRCEFDLDELEYMWKPIPGTPGQGVSQISRTSVLGTGACDDTSGGGGGGSDPCDPDEEVTEPDPLVDPNDPCDSQPE